MPFFKTNKSIDALFLSRFAPRTQYFRINNQKRKMMPQVTLRPVHWCEFCSPLLDPGRGVSLDLTNQEGKSSPTLSFCVYRTVEVSLFQQVL